MGDSLWEKALILGACLIAAAFMVIVAKREFFDSSTNSAPQVAQSLPGEALRGEDQSISEVAGASRPGTADAAEEDVPPEEPRRRVGRLARPDQLDCAFLQPRHDRSRTERLWYIDNCIFLSRKNRVSNPSVTQTREGLEDQLQAAGFTLNEDMPRRSVMDAAATPTSDLTADTAVSMAVEWIPANTPVTVSLSSGDCIPIWLNGHWVVTCSVTLDGCAVAYCIASLSVCVFPTEPAILPDRFC